MTEDLPSGLNQQIKCHFRSERSLAHHIEDGQGWYLVLCKPNAEQTALRNLENQKLSVFLPLHKTTFRRGTAFQTQVKPLFPGYIFVAQNPFDGQWHKINNTRGVARVVRFAAKPTPVPPAIMRELFACCDETSDFYQSASLNVGDEVKITQGSLTGSIAKIIKIEPSQRVHLLFNFMGQESKLEIDVAGVVPNAYR